MKNAKEFVKSLQSNPSVEAANFSPTNNNVESGSFMSQELSIFEVPYSENSESSGKALICTYFDSSEQYSLLRIPYDKQYLESHKLADGSIYSESRGTIALNSEGTKSIAKFLRYDLSTGEFEYWRIFEPRVEILEDLTQSDIEKYGIFVGSADNGDERFKDVAGIVSFQNIFVSVKPDEKNENSHFWMMMIILLVTIAIIVFAVVAFGILYFMRKVA